MAFFIGRMIHAVVYRHMRDQKWVHALETSYIIAVLIGERTSLMMGIDTTNATKVVFSHISVELIQLQILFPLHYVYSINRN